jgi:hypothetical protein
MGEVADDMITGLACSWCGTYFVEEHGYPVLCHGCWDNAKPEDREGHQKAIYEEI